MSDTSGSGFGKFVPGFEFLQNLAGQAAGGVAQGIGNSIPQLPNLGNWVAPTFNVEDLEKRIEELKAVHFWLDQNSKALGATIQALEVQKMTLATLKNMNFSLGDVANALKIKAADTVASFTGGAPAAAPAHTAFAGLEIPPRTYGNPPAAEAQADEADDEEDEPAPPPMARPRKTRARPATPAAQAAAPAGGVVDPMQWWGALSQQFQTIAASALKDVAKQTALDTTRQVASGLTEQAVKTATGMAGKVTRGLSDTVARNVGTAAGLGQAAARAVTGRQRAAPPVAKKAAPRPAAPAPAAKKAPSRTRAAAAPAARKAAQPMSAGDWPLPTSFFPMTGFQPAPPAQAPKPRAVAKKKATAKKATVRKAATDKAARSGTRQR
ncbi:PhaM family polyhydroxyalkanoate granule multifunctional regulatory protein [Hydrogenophaga taeniospiralis]|uniref:PhaM family polyhydroxyalkanoate granule multifunctional regulatory protein n=1 Tax=Hydrogenophaga taeniospiralis TaxID=65656 RepID=UPI000A05B621|nr:PhaM family polyhydroxyalkanoate granule multifunctional regulatory protein [Hydrogenophaga taeniospiralis]